MSVFTSVLPSAETGATPGWCSGEVGLVTSGTAGRKLLAGCCSRDAGASGPAGYTMVLLSPTLSTYWRESSRVSTDPPAQPHFPLTPNRERLLLLFRFKESDYCATFSGEMTEPISSKMVFRFEQKLNLN